MGDIKGDIERMRKVTGAFLRGAGYEMEDDVASNNGDVVKLYHKTSLSQLRRDLEDDIEEHDVGYGVFVVPGLTSEGDLNLNHFHNFYMQHSEKVLLAEMGLWIINLDTGEVNSLIGYPPDESLVERFQHPTLPSKISSMWRVNVEEDF